MASKTASTNHILSGGPILQVQSLSSTNHLDCAFDVIHIPQLPRDHQTPKSWYETQPQTNRSLSLPANPPNHPKQKSKFFRSLLHKGWITSLYAISCSKWSSPILLKLPHPLMPLYVITKQLPQQIHGFRFESSTFNKSPLMGWLPRLCSRFSKMPPKKNPDRKTRGSPDVKKRRWRTMIHASNFRSLFKHTWKKYILVKKTKRHLFGPRKMVQIALLFGQWMTKLATQGTLLRHQYWPTSPAWCHHSWPLQYASDKVLRDTARCVEETSQELHFCVSSLLKLC